MRRTHPRRHKDILKRQLIHVGGFNLSLILRQVAGGRALRGNGETVVSRFFWELIMKEVRQHGVQQDDQTLLLVRVRQ